MEKIKEKVLAQLNHDAFIRIDYSQKGLTRFSMSAIHQNVAIQDLVIILQLKEGKREATVTTNSVDDASIAALVKEGEEILALVPEGEVEVPLVREPAAMKWEGRDPALEERYGIKERAHWIKEGVQGLREGSLGAGALSLNQKEVMLANTEGLSRYLALDTVDFSVVVSSGQGTGYYQLETQKAEELHVPGSFLAAEEKARSCKEPILLKPGKYTVVLEPLAVSALLSYMAYAGFSGRSIQQGSSFLINKRGEKIFDTRISIYDDYQGEGTYNIPFDLEGTPKVRLDFIKDGIAQDIAHDLRSASIDGAASTGHSVGEPRIGGFPTNLYMAPGDMDGDSMVASIKKGILITRFNYTNVVHPRQLLLTGLTRDGTFLIEDGQVVRGIRDMRFTESLLVAFNQIEAIGKTLHKTPHFFGVNHVPALTIKDFTFTGVCEE